MGFMFAVLFRVLKRVRLKERLAEGWPASHWLGSQDLPSISRQFIIVQIMCSVVAFCAFPLLILWQGTLSVEMAVVFGWFMGPLVAAAILVRLRSLRMAFAVSSISFTGLICTISILTGGLQSFALIWLLAVPFEAILSRDKNIVASSILIVMAGGAALLHYTTLQSFAVYSALTTSDPIGFVFGPVALALYIASLAMKVQSSSVAHLKLSCTNEARYRLLAENTSDLIVQYDVSGNVVFASPAAKTLLGVDPTMLENKDFLAHVHIADRPHYMQALNDVTTLGMASVLQCRVKVIVSNSSDQNDQFSANHSYTWVEMRTRPIWSNDQVITGVISTMNDITKQRDREEELEGMHRDIKELNDAKGRFLANISHELRTPLNAIIGFSDILDQELFGKLQNDKQKEYVKLINESGNHLLQVVTDILDMSKIDSGTFDIVPEAFDVKRLVETCTSILSQQAEMRGIELRTIVPDNLPEAVADSRACRQILINLISNALKFSDENSRVTVGARLEGSHLAYFIRDNGIGMSKGDLERIGQPFFQSDSALDRRYEGTGLGVSVVKGLTELHKGHVAFESELGKGTCVTVYIPVNCEADEITIQKFNANSEITRTSVLEQNEETILSKKIA